MIVTPTSPEGMIKPMLPVILTVSGSDPSAGAGLQADLMAIAAAGGFGVCAVSALTVQNSRGLQAVHPVDPGVVRDQMEAILADMPVAAVKTGMLHRAGVVQVVAEVLEQRRPPACVVDPVLGATAGGQPAGRETVETIRSQLVPRATLLTPNVPEAERLSGMRIRTRDDAVRAGESLLADGAGAVLVKGGHLAGAPGTDVLVRREGVELFSGRWQDRPDSHGTGCVLASVVATYLGSGLDLVDAVRRGKAFLAGALEHSWTPGGGAPAVDPLFAWRKRR